MPLGNPIRKQNESRMVSVLATEGQTVFTVQGGYIINHISVFRNGVRLSNSEDFTAGDGSTVTLNNAANIDDRIEFHVFDRFTVQNAIVSAASTQTISGDVVVNGKIFGNLDVPSINTGIVTATELDLNGSLDVSSTSVFNDDVTFTGAAANITFDKSEDDLVFGDNAKAVFGTGGDLEIYHSSSNSFIRDVGTGVLSLDTNGSAIRFRKGTSDTLAMFNTDGAVELFHDGTIRLETTPSGADITGTLNVTGISTFQAVQGTTGTFTSSLTINTTTDQMLNLNSTDNGGTYIGYQRSGTRTAYLGHGGTGGTFTLRNEIENGNVDIRGNDGGSYVTMLNLNTGDGGTATFSSDLIIPDKIVHSGDTNTAIRFPSADTITAETGGSERLRIDSSGHMGLGISPSDIDSIGKALNIASSTGGAIYLQDTDDPTVKFGAISYNGATAALQIHAHHASSYIDLGTNGTERLRIDSSGRVLIGSTAKAGDSALQVYTSDRLHPAIRVHSANANGFTMFGDAYQTDESNMSIGISYSSASLVISQGCKVSTSSDNAYVSSQDSYSNKPNVFRLGTDGAFSFLNTNTSAATTTDSAVSLTERLRIDSSGQMGLGMTPTRMFEVKDSTGANRIANIRGTGASGAYLAFLDQNTTDDSKCRVGSAGGNNLVMRGDTVQFGTGAGSEFARFDASGRLLLGTTSVGSASAYYDNLIISNTTSGEGSGITLFAATNGYNAIDFADTAAIGRGRITYAHSDDRMMFDVGGNERLRIDPSGNLLIGTTSSEDTTGNSGPKIIHTGDIQIDGDQKVLLFRSTNSTAQKQSGIQWWNENGAGVQCAIFGIRETVTYAKTAIGFYTSENVDTSANNSEGDITERMRIVSQGRVRIKCEDFTNDPSSSNRGVMIGDSSTGSTFSNGSSTGGANNILFVNGNGLVGKISTSGSSTTYHTSSDYRLKENAVAISDGITRLKTLKPYRFNFKADASTTLDGFFAHEVSSAVPEAVDGDKDELYTEDWSEYKVGDPKMQSIDHSKLVPLLTAALQEAITEIETLKTKVAALEGS